MAASTALYRALSVTLLLALRAGAAEVTPSVPRTLAIPEAAVAAVPMGELLLSRATAQGVPLPTIAQALSTAPDLPAARTALQALKLASPQELRQSSSLEDALRTLWGEASRHIKEGPVDPSWAVPALVVKNGERTYYVHGLSHGFFYNLGRRDARKLEGQVKASGAPLLVEQNLPKAYGLSYAKEIVTSAEDRYRGRLPSFTGRLFGRAAHWAYFKSLGLIALFRGQGDFAGFMNGVAGLYAARHPSIEEARALELPLPLKASLDRDVVKRSRDMAQAAERELAKDVHLLVGWAHVFDLSWLLSGGPKS